MPVTLSRLFSTSRQLINQSVCKWNVPGCRPKSRIQTKSLFGLSEGAKYCRQGKKLGNWGSSSWFREMIPWQENILTGNVTSSHHQRHCISELVSWDNWESSCLQHCSMLFKINFYWIFLHVSVAMAPNNKRTHVGNW